MHSTAFLTTLLFALSATARGLPPPPSYTATPHPSHTATPHPSHTATPLPAAASMVPAPSSFPITEPCVALSAYQAELNNTRTSIATKKSSMQALELKQKLCHGCLTHDEVNMHGKLDWDVLQLKKVEVGQMEAVTCLHWMCGGSGGKDGKGGHEGHEVKKGGLVLKECLVLE